MAAQEANAQKGILVFSEDAEVLAELLTIGRDLGAHSGSWMTGVVVGETPTGQAEDVLARGADTVLAIRTDALPEGAEALAAALYQAVAEAQPSVILLGATRVGAELAARLGQKLAVPCASDCMALRLDEQGALVIERRVYGGRFVARQRVSAAPRLATVQPKRFARAAKETEGGTGAIREIAVNLPAVRVRSLSVSRKSRSQVDVTKAEIIVAAGRGIKRIDDLAMLEKLAGLLGGVVAGSRPLTGDLDWLPVDRRIGLSGQTVKPNLYIACGVSGQIEHIVGMRGARTVVAINNDAKAPIHAEADYSIVGDLYEIVPALIKACEQANGGAA